MRMHGLCGCVLFWDTFGVLCSVACAGSICGKCVLLVWSGVCVCGSVVGVVA
jgi:hypothetical protein